ncbi:MAG TPA: amino acid adenylation domain-containing protein, partial [Thermoanaerobaculia bacterium]|nr:amino acid adenylation domain-containing protein [Thermoanaerobaculia bacterium]
MAETTAATADPLNLLAGDPAAAGEEVFVFPASSGQRRLWFIDRLEPGSPLYNIPLALRLTGRLDEPALAAALGEIVRRHEAVRTTFDVEDDEPVQVVAPPGAFHLETIDLAAMPAAERREEARRLAAAEGARPFDLERGPLLRATLLRLGGEVPENHLLLTLHHIVADGWSLGVLAQELSALYAARRDRRSSPLPELPIQYADFAAWQHERLESGLRAQQMAYWRAQLGDAPRLLELPLARPRPAVRSHAGRRAVRALPPAAAAALRELCQREGVTPFMALFAAFQALLARTTGQSDLIVGTPIANRDAAETEGLIGLFVNTLALRTRVEGGASFRALLHQVRDAAVAAYAHQDLPFEELVEELAPERSLSHHPLVQAVFGLGDGAGTAPELAGLLVEPLAGEHGTVKFDLALTVEEGGGGLVARLDGSADLYDAAALARLLESFAALLAAALAAPEQRVAELPLWNAALTHQTLVEWNDTAAAPPEAGSALALFARAAANVPEAPALLAAAGEVPEIVTYDALDRWADRIARRLLALGVGPETRVAVAMEHAPARIAALLAVWKAGGAYVSLDPADPAERRAFQLADCGAPLLLVAAGSRVEAPEGVRVAEVAREGDDGDDAELPPLPDADRLAYVIYTSGSTGRPKGVEITHGGLLNLVAWHQAAYGVTAADRATQLAGVGFDASVWELWPYLAAGAAVAIPPAEVRADPARLVPWLADRGVTLAFLPTALAELALAEPWPAGAPLRALLVGGDRLHRPPPPGLSFRLVNHYGPTECSVVATCGAVEPAPADSVDDTAAPPPIGRPIANTRLVLVDADGRPVPPGVPGEGWLGGTGLARGYLGRPDFTAERFVPDPFSGEPGARLYRTGDLLRLLPGGAVEFLGRIDQQVKVRGFRIELGEVETLLGSHPGVRQAVAVVREDVPGDRRLVAYAMPAEPAPAAAELTAFLAERLPEYMVPSALVLLPELPRTAGGKLDRRALPVPESLAGEAPESGFAAPRTPVEEILASICAQVLGRD